MVRLFGGRSPLTWMFSKWTFSTRRVGASARAAVAVCALAAAGSAGVQAVAATAAGATEPATFGKTTIGSSSAPLAANHKQVSRFALPGSGSVTKLTVYLQPTTTAGQQVLKGVIYSDAAGKPEGLLGVSEQLTFTSTSAAGWYDLILPTPLKLGAGSYWIGTISGAKAKVAGFRFTKLAASRTSNTNKYTAGPSNPFGSGNTDAKQTSLYATYIPGPPPPVNSAPPTISGSAQQGNTLTESHGTWTNSPTSYAYQWLQCDSLGGGCLPIAGATKQTYVPVSGDVGHTLRVQETASNEGGSSSPATSEATATVQPPPPSNTAPPTISGTAQQGQTLTESHGTWTNNPTSYEYQWLQCDGSGANCATIAGATSQTYVPVAEDVGHTIRVQETATNAGGSSSPATSAQTAVVVPPPPANTAPPTISGTAREGQTLTESHGTWTNNPTSYGYQWLQCDSFGGGCLPIAGATSQTYVPVAEDVGHTIRVQEIASNAGGSSSPATSSATAAVLPALPPPPSNTAPPTISGTAQQGQTLTESHGSWTNNPTSYEYQWLQCDGSGANCATIAGATSQTYVPVAEDVGHTIRVQEIASNAGGSSGPATSEVTAAVLPEAPSNTAPPTISGTAQQGQTLTEAHGAWTNNPTSYAYQWLQCDGEGNGCTAISGAINQTYVVRSGDVGHTIRVQETASNAGGSSSPASSTATSAVIPLAPANNSPPTISGTAQQNKTLTEAHGAWTNNPTSYAYQWLQCDGEGNGCTAISGATNQTYVVRSGDVGHTIRVQEIASNAGGSSEPATSPQTAVVVPPPPSNTTLPTISGTAQQGQTLTATNGSWTNNPTSFTYQWQRCDSGGANCNPISGATAQTYAVASADVGFTLRVAVTATNAGGSSSPATSAQTAVVPDPVLAAVGDIACPAGDTEASCKQQSTANLTASRKPNAVAVLGDNQYDSGLLSEFNSAGAYNDTWGQFNPIVHPAPGNHEYRMSSTASGYFTYFGSAAGSGNYSYDLGAWHVISLNSDCTNTRCQDSIAGTTSDAEVAWLQGDLAAHPNQCTLAYWHHPRFSSGFVGNSPGVEPFWTALYAAHADVVLNGHDHMYERFALQDPSQNATSEGIREFVVGGGGESLFKLGTTQPNMQAVDNKRFGVLFLTLHGSSYDWAFRSTAGAVLDSGSESCHAQGGGQAAAQAQSSARVKQTSQSSAVAPVPAVQAAAVLAASPTPDSVPLEFDAQPVPVTLPAPGDELPVDIHCSRACDVDIKLVVRKAGHAETVVTYHETESEIPEPFSRIELKLPDSIATSSTSVHLLLKFAATDAADEVKRLRRALTLYPG
jgi:hypothetical protein